MFGGIGYPGRILPLLILFFMFKLSACKSTQTASSQLQTAELTELDTFPEDT